LLREAIRTAGARLLFVRKYSLGLNSIQQVFAKRKSARRKAEVQTVDVSYTVILATRTPTECANYLSHAGYAQS